MKNLTSILFAVILVTTLSCAEYETPVPGLADFTIYELTSDAAGNTVVGSPITSPTAGEMVRIEMITDADLAVIWTGDVSYRPWGANDSIIDSRNYADYGQPGAQGLLTNTLEGNTGFFRDFAWPEPGSYDVVVVLTNHGVAEPDFEQRNFEFSVTVQ